MPQPRLGRLSFAEAAAPDFTLPVRRSLAGRPVQTLGPVREPVWQQGDLLLHTGDRQRLGPEAEGALATFLGKQHPDCFRQLCLVRSGKAFELCADDSPAGSTAADCLLQGQHIQLPMQGGAPPLVLRVGVTSAGRDPGVQVLRVRGVPAGLRKEGLAAALLLAAGYAPSSFEVLAEGVGKLSAGIQHLNPGLGNGGYYLAYVRAPEGDFQLRDLPPRIVLEGTLLRVGRDDGSPPSQGIP